MKNLFTAILLTSLLISQGCATTFSHPAFKDQKFIQWSDSVNKKIKNNPSYKRIPIDTDKQVDQYLTIEYKAYKKEISNKQYIDELLKIYPRHKESIQWLANQLPR